MRDSKGEAEELNQLIKESLDQIGYLKLQKEQKELTILSQQPDFWNDQNKAKMVNKKLVNIKLKIDPWLALKLKVDEFLELINFNDDNLNDELIDQLKVIKKEYKLLKKGLLYKGKFDDYDAIVGIYAGTGGTDAMDWAEMMFRMYSRWVESQPGISIKIIDQSFGEEAGIKSVTMEIDGPLAYGKLKGEMGVHRLVRLSPFNANNLRQTSFAKLEIMPKIDQPEDVKIDEKDLKIDVYRAGGHGGQSVNTTDSAVRITHLPTGITVAIQNERSQTQNKETAMTILRSKLAQLQLEQHKETIEDIKGPKRASILGQSNSQLRFASI